MAMGRRSQSKSSIRVRVVRAHWVAWLVLSACQMGGTTTFVDPPPALDEELRQGTIALIGVNVWSPNTPPLLDQTIVVVNGVIRSIGSSATAVVPAGSVIPPVRGDWVMPGLFDMHAHNIVVDRFKMLGSGIVAVRGMWGTPDAQALQAEVIAGKRLGPRLFLASPGHDAPPGSWPLTRFVTDAAGASRAVDAVRRERWDFLKVYDNLSREAFQHTVAAAQQNGVRVVGHVPRQVPIADALAARMASIEHLSGYGEALTDGTFPGWTSTDSARIVTLARATRLAGVWNCPTLMVTHALATRSSPAMAEVISRNRRAFVKALYEEGARLLLGTDSGIDVVPPGITLINEMRAFASSGVPPSAILAMATAGAAEFLGVESEYGRVSVGWRGDVLLLSANPETEWSVFDAPRGLVLSGRFVGAAAMKEWRQ
jgi:imidazolonepropionase-like amidohydrolase